MISAELLGHILEQLGQVQTRCPELRFGQLLATVGELAADETGHSLWDLEDTDFAAALDRFAADIARRGERVEQTAIPDRGGADDRPARADSAVSGAD
jgi:hypothetical protein